MLKGMSGTAALAAVIAFLGFASSARCNSASIVVDPNSPGGGVFWYDLAVSGSATFIPGNVIAFSRMSWVTSASGNEEVSTAFGTNVTFTGSTATFVMGFPPSLCPPPPLPVCQSDTFLDDQGAPYSYFEIDPPSGAAVGLIDWSIQTSTDTFTGTVEGPVASTPEPTTLMLLALGMASLAVFRRKWYFRSA